LRRVTSKVEPDRALALSDAGSVARSVAGALSRSTSAYAACRLRSTRSRARFVPCSRAVVRLVLDKLPSMRTSVPSTPNTRMTIATMTSTIV